MIILAILAALVVGVVAGVLAVLRLYEREISGVELGDPNEWYL